MTGEIRLVIQGGGHTDERRDELLSSLSPTSCRTFDEYISYLPIFFFFLPRSFTATYRRFLTAPDQFLRFGREWKQRHVAVWLFWSDPVKKANRLRMDLIGAHRCFKRRSALRCSTLYFSRKLLEHGGLLARSEERAGTVTRHILRRKKALCFRLHFKPDFISGTATMAPARSLLPTGRKKKGDFGCLKVSVHESIYSCPFFTVSVKSARDPSEK